MNRLAALLLAFGLFFGSASLMLADSPIEEAYSLYRELRCPICEVSLEQSDTQIANQMKDLIKEKLAAGETPDQIKAYFVSRYGESILMSPPKNGLSLTAYVIPGIGLIFGAGIVGVALRQFRRGAAEAEAPPPPLEMDGDLAARVEAEIRAEN